MNRWIALSAVFGLVLIPVARAQDQSAFDEDPLSIESSTSDSSQAPSDTTEPSPQSGEQPAAPGGSALAPPEPHTGMGQWPEHPGPARPNVLDQSPAESDITRLDTWLRRLSIQSKVGRYVVGPLGIVAGSAVVGFGIWGLLSQDLLPGEEAAAGFSSMFVVLGFMNVAVGIFSLASKLYQESLYDRFLEAGQDGFTYRELGRFEGELRGLAEQARLARRLMMVSGFGLGAGGVVATALSAAIDDGDASAIGMIIGGAFGGVGLLLGFLSFIPSQYERTWDKYESGEAAPEGTPFSWSVMPYGGPDGGGLALAARY